MSSMVMLKIVSAALKVKAWTFKAKVTCTESKAVKFVLEAPQGLHHIHR